MGLHGGRFAPADIHWHKRQASEVGGESVGGFKQLYIEKGCWTRDRWSTVNVVRILPHDSRASCPSPQLWQLAQFGQ